MVAEDLGGLTVFCSETHRFGTDAVLLAHFALQKRAQRACDLGAGCGIIPLLLLRDAPEISVTAVELQPEAAALCERAVEHNSLGARLHVHCGDLRELPHEWRAGFDLVTMNPPYKKRGAGLMGENEGLNIARFELKCTLRDITSAAAALLRQGGRFCVCHRPERLCDLLYELRRADIEPKRMRCVQARADTEPMLVLVEGVYRGNAGMTLQPTLVLEDGQGNETPELLKIYERWRYERRAGR